jgi:hypothetical protein
LEITRDVDKTTAVHRLDNDGVAVDRPGNGQYRPAVQGATGGKVLGVQTRGKKNNPSYAVKVLLPDGRVRRVRVDACSGRVSD